MEDKNVHFVLLIKRISLVRWKEIKQVARSLVSEILHDHKQISTYFVVEKYKLFFKKYVNCQYEGTS